MNASPVVATTAAAMTASQAAIILQWLWAGLPSPMPGEVALALAAALIPVVHQVYRSIGSLLPKKDEIV